MRYPFNDFTGLDLAPPYQRALAEPGLTRVTLPYGEPAWLVTRHDEARLVLSDRRFSRAAAAERDAPRALPRVPGGIVAMDPPELTRIRSLAGKAFTARRVEALRPHVRTLTAKLLDRMLAAGPPADLVTDLALPIPISVICELLGVPAEDHERFRAWNDGLLSTSSMTPEQTQRNLGELSAYIGGLIERRRAEPADDLMTALIEAGDIGDRLSERELVLLCIAILVAGYEATASQIPNFTYTLLTHGDGVTAFARLADDPGRVEGAVEELLRYVPLASSAMFAHYATEDVRVGGTVVRAGEPVLVSIGAANRDERVFVDPGTLDPDRDARGHLAFGHGLHHCIGSALGRLELQEALRALVTRLPGLRLAAEPEWKTETFFRGPRTMPVTW
ncbi:cytochrome P450 [Amycolatopsis cihanbeyliensis]|uniref:cytochrome P450 n=1 Tax=Amycolatopsis cihanbeyliensis TaxID=1128664 RepID=UPI001FE423F1|nr:cytochrome P450 [Amycolatopsis cihanbeyliensis]